MAKPFSNALKPRSMGSGSGDLGASITQGANLETLRYKNEAALPNQYENDAQLFTNLGKNLSAPGDRPRGIGRNLIAGLSEGLAHGSRSSAIADRKEKFDKYEKEINYLQDVQRSALKQKQWYEQRANAKRELMPQVLAYMDNIDSLDPQSQRIMASDILNQYGSAIGEDFKLSSIDGSNPFLMTIQSDKGQQLFDLRSMFAGDEAIQQSIAMKMPEYQKKLQEERANKEREFDLKQDEIDVKKFKEGISGGKYGVREDSIGNPYGSVPLETLKKGGGARPILASINSEINLAKDIPVVLSELDKAEKIIKDNPKLGTGLNNWLSKGSFTKGTFMDGKLREAYEMLNKTRKRVAEAYIRAKGSAITNEEREIIESGLFDTTNASKSNEFNINSVRKELEIAAERGKFASEQLAKGLAATSESFNNYMKSQEQPNTGLPKQDDIWNQIGNAR